MDCWLWTASGCGGYGRLSVNGRLTGAHRFSWELANGPVPNALYVLHRCDNPPCVNPAHLFLGTIAANNKDRANKGRGVIGERSPRAKLTERKVTEIRALHTAGRSQAYLARAYGVSDSLVRLVVTGQAWKHVGGAR